MRGTKKVNERKKKKLNVLAVFMREWLARDDSRDQVCGDLHL